MTARILFTVAICAVCIFRKTVCSVPETTEMYSCQESSQTLKSENAGKDTNCEQNWNAEHIPIGTFVTGSVECHSPCINLKAGEMIISGCVNASLTVICYQPHVTEYRIHFVGLQSKLSPKKYFPGRARYGICASLLLLLLMVVGLAIHI